MSVAGSPTTIRSRQRRRCFRVCVCTVHLACRDGVTRARCIDREESVWCAWLYVCESSVKIVVCVNGVCKRVGTDCSARLPVLGWPCHSALTQGSPLCGSRMCPWLRCVDLLAVAACWTPDFYLERAKSPSGEPGPSSSSPAALCLPSGELDPQIHSRNFDFSTSFPLRLSSSRSTTLCPSSLCLLYASHRMFPAFPIEP